HARVLLRVRLEGDGVRGGAARAGADPGAAPLRGLRPGVGDRAARVHVPGMRAVGAHRGGERRRILCGVDRGRGGRMHRTKVRIVEEALDANNTIAQANRADFDRADVKVVNFMSAPGAGKTMLLERVVADLPGVRAGVLEGYVQGSLDADRLAAKHVPVTQLKTDSGVGGGRHL